jgi:hypothetical protein
MPAWKISGAVVAAGGQPADGDGDDHDHDHDHDHDELVSTRVHGRDRSITPHRPTVDPRRVIGRRGSGHAGPLVGAAARELTGQASWSWASTLMQTSPAWRSRGSVVEVAAASNRNSGGSSDRP